MEQVMGPLRVPPGVPTPILGPLIPADGFVRRHLRYQAEPGDFVPAWLLTPRDRSPRGAVLCLHQTTRAGKDEPAGLTGLPNLHYARELALQGWITLAPDYPNFGESVFDPYAHGYLSATMKGVVNHMLAVSLLLSLPGIRRVAACGHSLGGHNALFLAAFDPRVGALVSSCGFTSFAKYQGGDLKGWSHRGYMPRIATHYGCDPKRMPFDFPAILQAIAPRPLFINAPLHDANFDASGVDDCVAAARPHYQNPNHLALEHPDAAHDFPAATRARAWQFLRTVKWP
jgi:dienelactone hydrolase